MPSMPIADWSSGAMSSAEPTTNRPGGPIRSMLPEPLSTEAHGRWQALMVAMAQAGASVPESVSADACRHVLVLSDFFYRTARRSPDLAAELLTSGDLNRSYPEGRYHAQLAAATADVEGEDALMKILRLVRQREMMRIAYRDLAGISDLEQIMADLSALADACLQVASEILHRWLEGVHGTPRTGDGHPQRLIVVGMGKLGAEELNFSSDIDLIFAFPESGTTDGGEKPIPCADFFTRLVRQLIRVIGSATPEGMVFRVDSRLRPFGDNGPMTMSFDAMEDYYQNQGREWERYAWIKARVVAGNSDQGDLLMDRLKPFVYRRYLDYGSFDSLRGMKAMITAEVQRKGLTRNIKLGAGGIREIEFFGQIFQLMRGGVEPALQCRRIQDVLRRLPELHLVPASVCTELAVAYRFLRNTEHRLQEMADQQTHDLPVNTENRLMLAAAMGFPTVAAFDATLAGHRDTVHTHFQQLLEPVVSEPSGTSRSGPDADLAAFWLNASSETQEHEVLPEYGYEQSEAVFRRLVLLKEDPRTRSLSQKGRSRLDRLIPLVLKAASKADTPEVAFGRMLEIIGTIQQRTNYLALLIENPAALENLTRLATVSPWIVSFLSRHPVLLDELLDPRTLYTPPSKSEVADEINERLRDIDSDDLEYQIENLCIFKQVNTLRVAAADITGALPLMRTSDYLTDIAEVVLSEVVALAWRHLVHKHGRPLANGERPTNPGGFVVIGYGKLGGIELGYGSDLDLVFLHSADAGSTDGPNAVDNAQFYARLGQRIVHILTTHTRAGRLYEVDMRLRPSGSGGILVSHMTAFQEYQKTEAWTWEHQALTRARAVTGDPRLFEAFERIRTQIITGTRDPETLRSDVLEMREKMRQEAPRPEPGWFDIKQGAGSIVDIEFLVQYLVLRHASHHRELAKWSDNVRQLETLTQCEVIDPGIASLLKTAYLDYRATVHRMNLRGEPGQAPEARFHDLNSQVSDLWQTIMVNTPA